MRKLTYLKYIPDLFLLLIFIVGLIFWILLNLPIDNTLYLLVFLIIFIIMDMFIDLKKPKGNYQKELKEIRNFKMNESFSYSIMLLSLGFGAVVAGISLSLSKIGGTISTVLIITGGFFVLLGSAMEKFIYFPRREILLSEAK